MQKKINIIDNCDNFSMHHDKMIYHKPNQTNKRASHPENTINNVSIMKTKQNKTKQNKTKKHLQICSLINRSDTTKKKKIHKNNH